MTELRCTIRHFDGSATTADVTVATSPQAWSPADAKAFLWAVSRLPEAVPIYRISLVEVEREVSWRIEVVTGSASVGIGVHVRPDWAFTMGRNTQHTASLIP